MGKEGKGAEPGESRRARVPLWARQRRAPGQPERRRRREGGESRGGSGLSSGGTRSPSLRGTKEFLEKATGSGQGARRPPQRPHPRSPAAAPAIISAPRPGLGRRPAAPLRVRRGPRDPSAPRGASRPVAHSCPGWLTPGKPRAAARAPLGRPRTRPSCAHSQPGFLLTSLKLPVCLLRLHAVSASEPGSLKLSASRGAGLEPPEQPHLSSHPPAETCRRSAPPLLRATPGLRPASAPPRGAAGHPLALRVPAPRSVYGGAAAAAASPTGRGPRQGGAPRGCGRGKEEGEAGPQRSPAPAPMALPPRLGCHARARAHTHTYTRAPARLHTLTHTGTRAQTHAHTLPGSLQRTPRRSAGRCVHTRGSPYNVRVWYSAVLVVCKRPSRSANQ